MIDQLRQNSLFYSLSGIFIILGLVLLSFMETGGLVLYFGHNRMPFLNGLFCIITKFGEEIAYAAITILLLFVRFRYAIMIPIIGILVTILSYVLKTFFKHPRPAVYFRDSPALDSVEYVSDITLLQGLTSFPSGHTLSAFCLFGMLAYALHGIRFGKILQFICFVLAALIGISRVYLFQHFLKDIIFGAALGTLLAIVCIALAEWPAKHPDSWLNRSLSPTKAIPRA